jgi:cation diffusion facilitator family transporter
MHRFLFYWMIPKTLKQADSKMSTVRASYGRLEGWISILSNFLLFLSKLVVGFLINSIALIADSVHSLSDVLTSVIVIVGFKISEKPADTEHPFGHQRAEYIASLIISILLIVAGIEFIKTAYGRLTDPQLETVTLSILIFILFTILLKAWLWAFSRYIGKLVNSQMLLADAVHHLTDSISSILVLIAIVGARCGYPFLDGVGGIAVGIILIWAGFNIAREAADSLMGKPPTSELIAEIQSVCLTVDNVINTHDIVVHSYGEQKFISVHVEVDQKKSSLSAHSIGDQVETRLNEKFSAYVTAHVDPVDIDSEEVRRASEIIKNIVAQSSAIKDFHDLRFVKKANQKFLIFDLVPSSPDFKKGSDFQEFPELDKQLREAFPEINIKVNVDPVYIFN